MMPKSCDRDHRRADQVTRVQTREGERLMTRQRMTRYWFCCVAVSVILRVGGTTTDLTSAQPRTGAPSASDEELVRGLPGFHNAYAEVNGIRLHYVEGGQGQPLILLPGWPQTWWQFSRIMPDLAKRNRIIAVDLRGMGGSSKPRGGYDKKTMASDVHALVRKLGYDKVNIAGHDIGSMVAFSFAANYPHATNKLAMLDTAHPYEAFLQIPMLPAPGSYDPASPARHLWWFAFNQVPDLPEKLLEGRYSLLQSWVFDYKAGNKSPITAHDRAVYAAAYNSADAIRAEQGWYQTFGQDIADQKTYARLEMPVLGLGGAGYDRLNDFLGPRTTNLKIVRFEKTGHWIPEERPQETVKALREFFESE